MEEPTNSPDDDAKGRDPSRYSLTIEEVVLRFETAGLPRSKRSIQKSCKRGHLDCILSETNTGQRYLITEESVERRIEELKQIDQHERQDANGREPSRPDAEGRDTPRTGATGRDPDSEEKEESKRIEELELEIVNLKIDNRGKELFISQMVQERKELMGQVREGWQEAVKLNRVIGTLETRLGLPPSATSTESDYPHSQDGYEKLQ